MNKYSIKVNVSHFEVDLSESYKNIFKKLGSDFVSPAHQQWSSNQKASSENNNNRLNQYVIETQFS